MKKYAPDNRAKKDTSDAHEIAKQLACESAVLLKNDGILPISQDADVVVIGALAEQMRFQAAAAAISTRPASPMRWTPCGSWG